MNENTLDQLFQCRIDSSLTNVEIAREVLDEIFSWSTEKGIETLLGLVADHGRALRRAVARGQEREAEIGDRLRDHRIGDRPEGDEDQRGVEAHMDNVLDSLRADLLQLKSLRNVSFKFPVPGQQKWGIATHGAAKPHEHRSRMTVMAKYMAADRLDYELHAKELELIEAQPGAECMNDLFGDEESSD